MLYSGGNSLSEVRVVAFSLLNAVWENTVFTLGWHFICFSYLSWVVLFWAMVPLLSLKSQKISCIFSPLYFIFYFPRSMIHNKLIVISGLRKGLFSFSKNFLYILARFEKAYFGSTIEKSVDYIHTSVLFIVFYWTTCVSLHLFMPYVYWCMKYVYRYAACPWKCKHVIQICSFSAFLY